MAGYFFDSSAVVKLYHPEGGTPVVDQVVSTSGNQVRVSRLTVAELTSAFDLRNQKLVDHFVAADAILCEVAALEGFSVINPEHS